jgi:hypothetical protein
MVYLGLVWRVFGLSPLVTRVAMALLAALTVVSLYVLGRRVVGREIAAWSTILLALSPLFFAQSTLVHLDLAAALFTTLAVSFLLEDKLWLFALVASLAFLSKETAVVLLPVAWLHAWRRPLSRSGGTRDMGHGSTGVSRFPVSRVALVAPLLPLAAWTIYYYHVTGYWTGNREYLSYNLYSTLSPARVFFSLLRRAYELFIGGFNWLLTACAPVGFWWGREYGTRDRGHETGGLGNRRSPIPAPRNPFPAPRVPRPVSHVPNFIFLTAGLVAVYLLLLSLVGGAILPRYLLPVLPLFYLVAVALVTRLPRFPARLILTTTAVCFVWAWFINPPYPFPFEDNLAYVDFIRLHQQAAQYLEDRSGHAPSGAWQGQPPCDPGLAPSSLRLAVSTGDGARILTAWPATDELSRPFLGYVRTPLRVIAVPGFTSQELARVQPESFDLLYLYSRKWEPPGNWVARFPGWLRVQSRYFDYHPQVSTEDLAARYHLKLLVEFERRGQWVKIFRKAEPRDGER